MTASARLRHLFRAAWPRRRADLVQVGALPWRRGEGGKIEVLLVTSLGTGRWILPKGGRIAGLADPQAAAQEAWEEAGVRGMIEEREHGRFTHLKTRPDAPPLRCRVSVYRLAVEQELEDWPERELRKRAWFGLAEAAAQVESKELAALILALGEAGARD